MDMETTIIKDDIELASTLIKSGKLVAVPTETVYGLAGNGLDTEAVEKIYEVKGRPQIKPLALMIPDSGSMERYCEPVPEQAKMLAKRFWPGPLTIVLEAKAIVPEIVRAGGDTVALRCPDHPLTLELLQKTQLPLAAPSANPSGEPSPKNAAKVVEYFDGKISAVIDGGECGIGTESTIIDMSKTPYKILREAALPEETLRNALVDDLTVLGITGGTGCCKTTALRQLEALGAMIIDCDAVYHELLETDEKLLNAIETAFPGSVTDGKLDRKRLGGIVFGSERDLKLLNEITHHYISLEVERRLCEFAMNGGELAAIDAIALIESGLAKRCKAVIGIVAETETRVQRIMKRDGISREYAGKRIAAQKPHEFFENSCDYVLHNDTTERDFADKCTNLYKEVLKNV